MSERASTGVPQGTCLTHGYHGRAFCPKCTTQAVPELQALRPDLTPAGPVAIPLPVWIENALVTRCPRCAGNERPGSEYRDGSGACRGCGGSAWVVLATREPKADA